MLPIGSLGVTVVHLYETNSWCPHWTIHDEIWDLNNTYWKHPCRQHEESMGFLHLQVHVFTAILLVFFLKKWKLTSILSSPCQVFSLKMVWLAQWHWHRWMYTCTLYMVYVSPYDTDWRERIMFSACFQQLHVSTPNDASYTVNRLKKYTTCRPGWTLSSLHYNWCLHSELGVMQHHISITSLCVLVLVYQNRGLRNSELHGGQHNLDK